MFVEENPVPEVGGRMEIPVYYCVCGTMKILYTVFVERSVCVEIIFFVVVVFLPNIDMYLHI